jgi:excisionase family DNA binding protein
MMAYGLIINKKAKESKGMIKHVLDRAELTNKKLLTKQEACFYIGISLQTLNRLINKTEFPAMVRIGFGQGRVFINREILDQWIDAQTGK